MAHLRAPAQANPGGNNPLLPPETHPGFWKWVTLWYSLAIVTTIVLLLAFPAVEIPIINENVGVGWFVLILLAFYTIGSIQILGPDEIGSRSVLGVPKSDHQGWVFVPLVFCELIRVPRGIIQMEIPSNPENIWRGDPHETVPPGKFPPIRITFAADKRGDTDPLSRRVTEEAVPIIGIVIQSPTRFTLRVGGYGMHPVDYAKTVLEDETVAFFTMILTRKTVATTLRTLEKINKEFERKIEAKIQDWGVSLDTAKLKTINFSKDLNVAIQSGAVELAAKEGTIQKAQAEKQKRKLEGEGTAAAEAVIISERGKAMEEAAGRLKLNGEQVLAAETARSTLGKDNDRTVVLGAGGGLQDLYGIAAMLQRGPNSPPPIPPQTTPPPAPAQNPAGGNRGGNRPQGGRRRQRGNTGGNQGANPNPAPANPPAPPTPANPAPSPAPATGGGNPTPTTT